MKTLYETILDADDHISTADTAAKEYLESAENIGKALKPVIAAFEKAGAEPYVTNDRYFSYSPDNQPVRWEIKKFDVHTNQKIIAAWERFINAMWSKPTYGAKVFSQLKNKTKGLYVQNVEFTSWPEVDADKPWRPVVKKTRVYPRILLDCTTTGASLQVEAMFINK